MPEINNKEIKPPVSRKITNPSVQTKQTWYQMWHDNGRHGLTHWLILIVIVVAVWLGFNKRISEWILSFNPSPSFVNINSPATTLALDPQALTVAKGNVFPVNIVLHTGGNEVDGVDIYSIHYDPAVLEVIDDNSQVAGTQILPGKILPLNAANIVDAKTGTIKLGQVATGGTSYQGEGVLATIHFKAINTGTTAVTFDFSPGSTIDSNAAYHGKDKLAKVIDAQFTIEQPVKK